jgi:hypothetical protein
MEIHKPKPVHNWRELLTEIGVIVVGIAVALTAEQLVESVHWQNKIRDARRAMAIELRDDDGPQAYIRIAVEGCRNKQLDVIRSAIVGKATRTEVERLTSEVVQANVTWDSVGWNTLQTSDVASHLSPEELRSWSVPYVRIPSLENVNLQESRDVVALQPSGLTDEVLTVNEVDTMLAAIKRLQDDNRLMAMYSAKLLSGMLENGVQLTSNQRRRMQDSFRKLVGGCIIEPNIVVDSQFPYAAAASEQ